MGQIKLLLFLLGILFVAQVAILGMDIFEKQLGNSKIESIVQDGERLASEAQIWKSKHAGTGNSAGMTDWQGLTFSQLGYNVDGDANTYVNENGTFLLSNQKSPALTIIARSHPGSEYNYMVIVTVDGMNVDDVKTVVLDVDNSGSS